MGSWRLTMDRIFEARPLHWIYGRMRNFALFTTSCRFLSRCADCQPMKLSRAASFQALAPKLSKASSLSPAPLHSERDLCAGQGEWPIRDRRVERPSGTDALLRQRSRGATHDPGAAGQQPPPCVADAKGLRLVDQLWRALVPQLGMRCAMLAPLAPFGGVTWIGANAAIAAAARLDWRPDGGWHLGQRAKAGPGQTNSPGTV